MCSWVYFLHLFLSFLNVSPICSSVLNILMLFFDLMSLFSVVSRIPSVHAFLGFPFLICSFWRIILQASDTQAVFLLYGLYFGCCLNISILVLCFFVAFKQFFILLWMLPCCKHKQSLKTFSWYKKIKCSKYFQFILIPQPLITFLDKWVFRTQTVRILFYLL